MRLPLNLLGLSAIQTVFQSQKPTPLPSNRTARNFEFAEAADVFSPKDLVELGRPGTGIANEVGDLVVIPYSEFSGEDKK